MIRTLIEILFYFTITLMSIAIYNFASATIKVRKSFSIVFKAMIDFIIITIVIINHVLTKNILFSYGEFIIIISVIIEEKTHILFSKVHQLTYEFEKHFYDILNHWNGNLDAFASSWFILDEIFPITKWEHKKSVDEFKKNLMSKIKYIKEGSN
ncbi:MAG: hypothetical protein ACFFD2_06355 [Promethearchaeota archaeon]